jgi:hypothetical protein
MNVARAGIKGRKAFFFEKKKQKTFFCLLLTWSVCVAYLRNQVNKSFLVLFSKKNSFFVFS